MVTALEKLEKERDGAKVSIDHIIAKLAAHAAHPLTEVKVDYYLNMLGLANLKVLETFEKIITSAPADMGPHNIAHFTLIDMIVDTKSTLEEIKATFNAAAPPTPPQPKKIDIRLPRLEPPSFDGNIQNWMSFNDMFTATIHNNATLTKAQKLSYLKSSLTGEAARQIKSIGITDDNYDIAWTQLSDRYQNERELLFSVMRRFVGQATLPGNSAAALRTLIDVSKECFRSMETLTLPVDQGDSILLFIVFSKLDQQSREIWEQTLTNSAIPPLQSFLEFLEQRARALAAGGSIQTRQAVQGGKVNAVGSPQRKVTHAHHIPAPTECKVCRETHPLFKCPKFLEMSIPERYETLKKYSLCFNCLRDGHPLSRCTSQGTCRTCNGKHHTLLHRDRPPATNNREAQVVSNPVINHHSNDDVCINQTMLATALVKIQDCHGQYQVFRVLMDGGSNSSFITESCMRRLGIARGRNSAEVKGLASTTLGTVKGAASLVICPYIPSNESYITQALIMPQLTTRLPLRRSDPTVWPHLQGLELADPHYYEPDEIDLLLGADIFYYILLDGKRTGPTNSPVAVKTTFGWLVAGNLNSVSSHVQVHTAIQADSSSPTCTDVDLDHQLQKFWEIENVPTARTTTKEEEQCENHFVLTHEVLSTGRFIVRLPFKTPPAAIGSSRDIAVRRLKQLEGRFIRQPDKQQQYRDFMMEYLTLGHMQEIPSSEITSSPGSCYIPHHFVMKESSTTTKLRVVFDASAKTSTGKSLNDILMVGPTIQDNLADILTRFRIHPIAFVADITKMYRQFLVNPIDTNYQRIVWRDLPTEPIKDYQLLTVTYGTGPAPFLATRALQQLATNAKDSLPLAYIPTMRDFYVDNLMTGAQTVPEALQIQAEVLQLMKQGEMELRQWSSNSVDLLNAIPLNLRETKELLSFDVDQTVKTLGVFWNPVSDQFSFKVTLADRRLGTEFSKRILASEVAKIFDPQGWLAPTIIRAKILIQDLWKLQLGWDDPLPSYIQQQWYEYRSSLINIEQITIPRCVIPAGYSRFSLAGFCDASEKAYAAVVYLCVFKDGEPPKVSLIASKTRVAPAKQVSLPRLELCGALLLSQLVTNVKKSLSIPISSINVWTDSTVVLAWIQAHPSRWKTFVANRVTEIQARIPNQHWAHVSGIENPADCASRGLAPSELQNYSLWWNGPEWLKTESLPDSSVPESDNSLTLAEAKSVVICSAAVIDDQSVLHKYSSLRTLKRVTAFILRFISNCLTRIQFKKSIFPCQLLRYGPLSTLELETALLVWIHIVQQEQFSRELHCLNQGHPVPNKSSVKALNPFLDSQQILRVGGRLRNAALPSDQRRPILLPRHHQLTRMLIRGLHLDNLHAGPQLLLSIIHKRFWIVGAKDAVRHELKKCVICVKNSATLLQQLMGDLPSVRVTPSRPFQNCGTDFAGPFLIRPISSRSKITLKAYLALFVCFSTHAVHLEVVSDLSTAAFIAALHRFISRRGKPVNIYSDCGTNYVGAAREIKESAALFQSSSHNNSVADKMSSEGISWHFNPPGAPHFGGLWEAGVKSVKYHLRRVVGLARLTFEELTTTMTQIEACLNSRPLTPVSTDPSDLEALTPGHFLIGAPLTALPEPDLQDVRTGRLSRWQLIQQMNQQFWRRWSNEFISRLQQRPKWLNQKANLEINDMVIVKDENLPPLKWKIGRVIQTHPGPDGLIRVVTLRTSTGEIQRPIVKLCLLPMDPASTVSVSATDISPVL